MERKALFLRVPTELHDWLSELAAGHRRTVNAQAIMLLEAARGPAAPETEPPPARSASRSAPAKRIPDDFTVSSEMKEWARKNIPGLLGVPGRGTRETEKFIDHWRGASGANARKRDWTAAWRNWMRKADDDLARPPVVRPTRQQETDGLFDRAMERARVRSAKEAESDSRGNRHADPVHKGALPPAGDR